MIVWVDMWADMLPALLGFFFALGGFELAANAFFYSGEAAGDSGVDR